jgi:hypothetical protein
LASILLGDVPKAIVVEQEDSFIFDLLRYRHHNHAANLVAFDVLDRSPPKIESMPLDSPIHNLRGIPRIDWLGWSTSNAIGPRFRLR